MNKKNTTVADIAARFDILDAKKLHSVKGGTQVFHANGSWYYNQFLGAGSNQNTITLDYANAPYGTYGGGLVEIDVPLSDGEVTTWASVFATGEKFKILSDGSAQVVGILFDNYYLSQMVQSNEIDVYADAQYNISAPDFRQMLIAFGILDPNQTGGGDYPEDLDFGDNAGGAYGPDGYDADGYDQWGYNKQGYNADGYDGWGYDQNGFNSDGYAADGSEYNSQGYNFDGFNNSGINVNGSMYDDNGYDVNGYNANGFNSQGFSDNGTIYNDQGYDSSGYNQNGFDEEGYMADGAEYDSQGYDYHGYDVEGYNSGGVSAAGYTAYTYAANGGYIDGYDPTGHSFAGYTAQDYAVNWGYINGFDANGYIADGGTYNTEGYDVGGYNEDGYNILGYSEDGFSAVDYVANGGFINGFNQFGYSSAGYTLDQYLENGGFIDGFDYLGTNPNGTFYDDNGYDVNGLDANGYDIDGFDANGYNIIGYDQNGFDTNGYDINGYDQNGFEANGMNINGTPYNTDGYNVNGLDAAGNNSVANLGTNQQGPFDNRYIYVNGVAHWLATFNDQREDFQNGYSSQNVLVLDKQLIESYLSTYRKMGNRSDAMGVGGIGVTILGGLLTKANPILGAATGVYLGLQGLNASQIASAYSEVLIDYLKQSRTDGLYAVASETTVSSSWGAAVTITTVKVQFYYPQGQLFREISYSIH